MGIKIGNTDISKIKIASGLTPRLPSAYQEVEYIQSSGTQYINTGISAPNGFKAILKVAMVATGGASQTIIGSHNLNSPYGRNNINVFTSGNTWGLHMNDEMINSLGSVVIGDVYEVDGSTILGASYLDVDGVRLTTGNNTSPMSSNNILIFTNQYEVNAHSTFVSAKLYSCMLYNSSYELVRDFVPCYRIADGVIGMYDLVNNQFYTNSGTGTFNKGTDANLPYKEIRKVYKGSTQVRPSGGGGWQPGANTLLYLPLNSTDTYTDKSGNNVQTTSSGVSFGTYQGVDCAYFDFNGSHKILIPAIAGTFPYITMSVWSYMTNNSSNSQMFMIEGLSTNLSLQPSSSGQLQSQTYDGGDHFITDGSGLNAWHHSLVVWDNGTSYLYVDGQLIGSNSGSSITDMYIFDGSLGAHSQNNLSIFAYGGYLSEAILEDKTRTAQEVADYFNQTKANYGIS